MPPAVTGPSSGDPPLDLLRQRARFIEDNLDVDLLDWWVTEDELRAAADTLDRLEPGHRGIVLSLLADDTARDLASRLGQRPEPRYRGLSRQISSRYSRVLGMELECPPAQRARVTHAIRQMFRQRPRLATALARAELSIVVGAPELRLNQIPEAPGRGDDIVGIFDGGRTVVVQGDDRIPTLVHELAHAVHALAATPPQRQRIRALFHAAKGTTVTGYATRNEREFFAEAAEIYLTGTQLGRGSRFSPNPADEGRPPRELLLRHHPALAALLQEIFGTGPSVTPNPEAEPVRA